MNDSNNIEKKVINGVFSLLISGLIVKMLGLIYKIPLSYILSDEGMGYFNSAYTVYTFFYIICTAGVPKAISILIAQAESEGKEGYAEKIYKIALNLFLILGMAITILFIILSKPLSLIIGNSGATLTMISIAPSIVFVCATGVIRGYFNGKLNFIPIALSEVISGVAKLVLGIIFANIGYKLGFDLPLISAFTIFGITIASFLGYIYLEIYIKSKKIVKKTKQTFDIDFNKRKIINKIFKIAIPITITSTIGSISNIIDLSVIMHRLKDIGYSELQSGILYGNYTTLVIPMINLLGTIIAPITCILLPLISKSEYENNTQSISSNISITLKTVSFFVMPIAFIFCFRAYDVLSIIFEDSSAAMAAPLLQILAPGAFIMSLVTVLNTSLEGMGKTKIPMISLSVAAIFKLIFTFLFVGNENYSILGAPLGTSLSYFIAFIISFYYVAINQKISINFIKTLLQVLAACTASIIISSLFRNAINANNVLGFIFEMFVFGVTYIIMLYILKFYKLQNILKIGVLYKNNIK